MSANVGTLSVTVGEPRLTGAEWVAVRDVVARTAGNSGANVPPTEAERTHAERLLKAGLIDIAAVAALGVREGVHVLHALGLVPVEEPTP